MKYYFYSYAYADVKQHYPHINPHIANGACAINGWFNLQEIENSLLSNGYYQAKVINFQEISKDQYELIKRTYKGG